MTKGMETKECSLGVSDAAATGQQASDVEQARRLYHDILDTAMWWFCFGPVGTLEARRVQVAEGALAEIVRRTPSSLLGPVLREVEQPFREELGEFAWAVFWYGTDESWRPFSDGREEVGGNRR